MSTSMKTSHLLVLALFAHTVGASAQSGNSAGLEFEVASIRLRELRTTQDQVASLAERLRRAAAPALTEVKGRWYVGSATLREVLVMIYPEYPRQRIVGGPDWVDSLRFDIDARTAESASAEQIRSMARRLLADRFRLQLSEETHSLDSYALTVAGQDQKPGPGLRPPTACERVRVARNPPIPDPPPPCQLTPLFKDGVPVLSGGAATMGELIKWLQMRVDQPIVDRTGLTGEFAIDFEVPPAAPAQTPGDDTLPVVSSAIFTAVREQLGLRLVGRKEQTPVLVIRNVEKPTPN